MALSHAQATEVAKRFDPGPGRELWFADDGSLLAPEDARRVAEARGCEVYVCRRPVAGAHVEVARVVPADFETGAPFAYGEAW